MTSISVATSFLGSFGKTQAKEEMAEWKSYLQNANWPMVYYMTLVHIGAAIGIACLFDCHWRTYCMGLAFYYLSCVGITAGSHRLWSHRSYKAHGSVRFALMLCTCIANQGTIFHWTRDHRVHHKYSDTPADPHNSGRGFFFAHMGWLLQKKSPEVTEAGKKLKFDDLWDDWVVVLQEKCNPWGQMFMCFLMPTLVTMKVADESWFNALFVAGFLKYALSLHATWLVNSAAHFYGYQPYADIPPRENAFVSFFAIGEGWHNWHHKFPYDYATSEFGASEQYNPTKLMLDFLAQLGLVYDRRRATHIWEGMKKKKACEVKLTADEKLNVKDKGVASKADDEVSASSPVKVKST